MFIHRFSGLSSFHINPHLSCASRKAGMDLVFNLPIWNMWHDQGKWVTCRKFQFQLSYITFSKLKNASFWCKPHYNWISGYRVIKDLTMLKNNMKQRNFNPVLPIPKKQHPRHPTHSSWSCHICDLFLYILPDTVCPLSL